MRHDAADLSGRVQLWPGADLRPGAQRFHRRGLGNGEAAQTNLCPVPPVSADPDPLLAAAGGGNRQAALSADRAPAPDADPDLRAEASGGRERCQRTHGLPVLPAPPVGRDLRGGRHPLGPPGGDRLHAAHRPHVPAAAALLCKARQQRHDLLPGVPAAVWQPPGGVLCV